MASCHLKFDEENHLYSWHDNEIPSVTQVLSSVARIKNGKMTPVCDSTWCKNDTAANFGKAVHKYAALSWSGTLVDYPKEMNPWVKQFNKYKKNCLDIDLQPLCDEDGIKLIEYPIYHHILRYAGTPDVILGNEKLIFIDDFKTSTSEMDYWKYQTAAYAELFKNNFKYLIRGRKIITRSIKFGEKTFVPHTNLTWQQDYNYFLSCLNVLKG